MSPMPSEPPAQSWSTILMKFAALGAVIATGVTLAGRLDTALDRAPFGLLAGASFACGGLLLLTFQRYRSR